MHEIDADLQHKKTQKDGVGGGVGDPDPHVLGPPGSEFFFFLIKVVSGRK
jgi:hypothetical protein